jgi:dTDP-4-amino-4,6-dideoxygalactose transaminase
MAKLAIKGGPAEARGLISKIPNWPMFDDEDKQALIKVLESRHWCRLFGASQADLFEKAFADYQDAGFGVAVSNGTVSLELCLKTLGVKPLDEVIVPAATFIATASAVTEVGAIPIMVDIDPDTATMSSKALEQAITEKTRGVIVVHYGGYPANFDEILPIVRKNNVFLVEDAAHAHGTEWRGRKVGAIGDMGSFSFQESKSLAAGEGGIVLTDSNELFEKARLIHNIGRVLGRPGYEHYILSSNYRIGEFQAALLLSSLGRLPGLIEVKNENGKYLASKLRKIGGIEPLKEDSRITKRGYYMFVMRYYAEEFGGLPRDSFLEAMQAEGVPVGKMYAIPLYKQPAFRKERLEGIIPMKNLAQDYENLYLPACEKHFEQEVILEHQVLLAEKKSLDSIVASVEKIKQNIDEIL